MAFITQLSVDQLGWTNLHNQSRAPRDLDCESRTVPDMEQSFNKRVEPEWATANSLQRCCVSEEQGSWVLYNELGDWGEQALFKLLSRGKWTFHIQEKSTVFVNNFLRVSQVFPIFQYFQLEHNGPNITFQADLGYQSDIQGQSDYILGLNGIIACIHCLVSIIISILLVTTSLYSKLSQILYQNVGSRNP